MQKKPDHIFDITNDPAGTSLPSYTSSFTDTCGTPKIKDSGAVDRYSVSVSRTEWYYRVEPVILLVNIYKHIQNFTYLPVYFFDDAFNVRQIGPVCK